MRYRIRAAWSVLRGRPVIYGWNLSTGIAESSRATLVNCTLWSQYP